MVVLVICVLVFTVFCIVCTVFLYCFIYVYLFLPVPVAARSKAWYCGRSPAEIVGSNPTGGMDLSVVSVVCSQVEVSATN